MHTGNFHVTVPQQPDTMLPNKKTFPIASGRLCAQDKIRTCTPFPAPPPQSGLSTSFNTWAFELGRKFN